MRVVTVVAVAALFALVVALVGGGPTFAVIVIALATLGIVLLVKDWRADRTRHRPAAETPAAESAEDDPMIHADELTPDISTHPDGPTSDARAD